MSDDSLPPVSDETITIRLESSSVDTVITGRCAPSGGITNTGRGRLRFICANGPDIVIEPGETAIFELNGHRIYRIACNDCGLADGSHATWCPLWEPYVVSEG